MRGQLHSPQSGTDLQEKFQRLKVISHFTAKICKDKDRLPVASA